MKKSISWRQRQYVGNYLLNLETQGETFHVINVSWFSMKVYHKLCSFNIYSSFSAGSIFEGAKRTLQYMPKKISNNQSHSLSMHDVLKGEKSEPSNLTIFMLAQSGISMMHWGFCAQKYYGINIGDSYMRLFLGQSNTIV